MLFVLTLEPFLRKIRENRDIHRVTIADKQYKMAAFADDILLFLSKPSITLPNLLKNFRLFQFIAHFKFNVTKSHALNITLTKPQVLKCKQNFPSTWKSDAITYLGIQMLVKLANLYSKNDLPLLRTIKEDLKKWNKAHFSWFDRAAIIKINTLPRILYLLQTIPIKLPNTFIQSFKKICRTYLWNQRHTRIRYTQLIKPKIKGGIGLPDIQHYYWSCHLQRIIDWHTHQQVKDWVDLENSFSSHLISCVPWICHNLTPKELTEHPTIGPTLECFTEICHKLKLSKTLGPLSPILLNPQFSPGMAPHALSNKQKDIGIHIYHLLRDGKLLNLEHMNTLWAEPNLGFLEYLQIKQYITYIQCKTDLSDALTPFENLCLSHMPQRHVISKIHNMLWDNTQADEGTACKAWAKDLDTNLTNTTWERIYQNLHKGSINVMLMLCYIYFTMVPHPLYFTQI